MRGKIMAPSPRAARIVATLQNRKGQYVRVQWTRTVKTRAAFKAHTLSKTVVGVCRTGIDYAHMAPNEGRTTGSLPWGAWSQFPWIVEHKGAEYLRLTPESMTATYTLDGVSVDKAMIAHMLPASKGGDSPLTVTVKLADNTHVGGVSV
jgi:hypothetical protein